MKFVLFSMALMCMLGTGCSRSRKKSYTSETYYERTSRWYWTDKYTEIIVAVPIDDKVEPAFLVTRDLYERDGKKYRLKNIRTVNLEVYEAANARQQKLLNNLFNFFRGLAMLGTLAMVVGIFLFILRFKFPMLPSIWDEFLLYGGLATCIGMLGAWYVEQFILVSTCGGAALVAAAGYSLLRDHRKTKKFHQAGADLEVRESAVKELVETVELLKLELGPGWERVKNKLQQLPETKELVDKYQGEAKMIAEDIYHAVPGCMPRRS